MDQEIQDKENQEYQEDQEEENMFDDDLESGLGAATSPDSNSHAEHALESPDHTPSESAVPSESAAPKESLHEMICALQKKLPLAREELTARNFNFS